MVGKKGKENYVMRLHVCAVCVYIFRRRRLVRHTRDVISGPDSCVIFQNLTPSFHPPSYIFLVYY